MPDFYDELVPQYHLIHQDWDASIRRQGEQLSALIKTKWPKSKRVLDVSCGIGTQAIGLAQYGYCLTGSDISAHAIGRAEHEARARGVKVPFSVCDMRQAHGHHGSGYDVVVSCDNSLPHLLTVDDLPVAFKEMLACLSGGGGCVVSVRGYETEQRGANIVRPYGVRTERGKRYFIFQVWDFDGEQYDLSFFFVEEDLSNSMVKTHVMRSRYYAISITRLLELMRQAGFKNVRRLDHAFYQPVLVGTRAKCSCRPTVDGRQRQQRGIRIPPAIVQLFFKLGKQRFKRIYGTSENAVATQVRIGALLPFLRSTDLELNLRSVAPSERHE